MKRYPYMKTLGRYRLPCKSIVIRCNTSDELDRHLHRVLVL